MRTLLLAGFSVLAACGGESTSKIDWVSLPAGCFEMGSDRAYAEEMPAHETCTDAFRIARTEVTNAQFAAFVNATGYVTSAEQDEAVRGMPMGSAVFRVVPGGQEMSWWHFIPGANWKTPDGPDGPKSKPEDPVVHVTQRDAQAFADWVGGRLPTEIEWEYAAQVDAETSADHTSIGANVWQGLFPGQNTVADGYAGAAPVKSFAANHWGLYDMIGNVWEWTATPYAPSHAENDRRLAGPNGLDFQQPGMAVGSIKGGSFLCAENYCRRFRPAARQAQDLQLSTSHLGFRVVKDSSAEAPDSLEKVKN